MNSCFQFGKGKTSCPIPDRIGRVSGSGDARLADQVPAVVPDLRSLLLHLHNPPLNHRHSVLLVQTRNPENSGKTQIKNKFTIMTHLVEFHS